MIGVFYPFALGGQTTVTGKVTSNLVPVPDASILLKRENTIITYSITDSLGNFKLHFNEKARDSFFIEVNSLSHETLIYPLNGSKTFYGLELKERVNTLDEIFIANKITVKNNDTVYYNIKMFKDGTEEYVEDLLKKLPGIIVENDGTIKYNNKRIKQLLLNGDDLFGSKYTIGSKNIDANMVDSVQVYKRFSENALLKGIQDSDEVAINLSLKKDKTDISGNARIGYGYKDVKDIHATAFLLKSRSKAFSVTSFNNLGIDKSPFLTGHNSTDHLISRGNFGSELDKKYHLINNSFYSNISFLHRFSEHLKMNLNFNYLKDELNRNSKRNLTYITPVKTFSVMEINRMKSKPVVYDEELSLEYQRKDIKIKYHGNISILDESFQNISSSNFLLQENDLITKDFSSIHNGEFTYKINDVKVIVNNTNYTFIKSKQDFQLTPGNFPTETVSTNFQESNFSKELFSTQFKLYQSFSKLKIENALGLQFEENKFFSLLLAENELINNYANDLTQKRLGFEYSNFISYQINPKNKLKINLSLFGGKVQFYNELANQNILLFNYDVDYSFMISKKSTFSIFQSLDQKTPRLLNMFDGRVVSSYRSIIENVLDFEKIQVSSLGFVYKYDDFINLTKLWFTLNYQHSKNDFYFQNYVDYDKTILRSLLLNKGRNSYNLMITGEKFFNDIRTTFSPSITFAYNENFNYINDSNLRDIENESLQVSLKTRTDLNDGRLNFENSINYYRQEVSVQQQHKSTFDKIFYTFTLNYQPFKSPFYFSSEVDFYYPNLNSSETYFFNNYEFSYKPQNHKLEYNLKVNNITNNRRYQNTFITDFYNSQYSYNLIERNVLLSIKYKF